MIKVFKLLIFIFLVYMHSTTHASEYIVDHAQSEISFSSTHAGENFTGVFRGWNAEINFDATNLDQSYFKATFDMTSAQTGNTLYDETLPKSDWFDIKNFPKASFESKSIKALEDKVYQTSGVLKIKDIPLPVTFQFTLSDLDDKKVQALSTFSVNRLNFDIGQASDPEEEWVTNKIEINLKIIAKKP